MRYAVAVLFAVLIATTVAAQTFEVITPLRVTDTPASVRSSGLGSTSIPFSADAATAEANPAAIASLRNTIVGVSAAAVSFDTISDQFGDNIYRSFSTRNSSVGVDHAFAATPAGPFVLAAWYRHDPDIHSGGPFALRSNTLGSPSPGCVTPENCTYAFYFTHSAAMREDRRYGGAAAWRHGNVSIGIGAELLDLDERVETPRVRLGLFGNDTVYDRVGRRMSGRDVLLTGGIMWRALPRLTLAASYADGGSFDRDTTVCGTNAVDSFACSTSTLTVNRTRIERPNALRAGALLRVTSSLQVAAEAVRRDYSVDASDPYLLTGFPGVIPYRDVTELHAGAEYAIGNGAIRAGWWRDPSRLGSPYAPQLVSARDINHLTLGGGVAFGTTRLDIAYDNASRIDSRKVAISLAQSW